LNSNLRVASAPAAETERVPDDEHAGVGLMPGPSLQGLRLDHLTLKRMPLHDAELPQMSCPTNFEAA
jgi:hypothetical protein